MDETLYQHSAKSLMPTKQDAQQIYCVKSSYKYLSVDNNSHLLQKSSPAKSTISIRFEHWGKIEMRRLQAAEFQARKYSFEISTDILSFLSPLFSLSLSFFFCFLILHRLPHGTAGSSIPWAVCVASRQIRSF